MATSAVNSGGRLDRLPISAFHYRVLGLVGAGMFLDAFEIYLARAAFSRRWQNPDGPISRIMAASFRRRSPV